MTFSVTVIHEYLENLFVNSLQILICFSFMDHKSSKKFSEKFTEGKYRYCQFIVKLDNKSAKD